MIELFIVFPKYKSIFLFISFTIVKNEKELVEVYELMKKEIDEGHQVYVVSPTTLSASLILKKSGLTTTKTSSAKLTAR